MGEEDYLGAARQFRDAARVMPGWTAPLNNLALCQFQLGNTDQALEGTERVLASAPGDVNALTALVRFLTILGRQAEAKAHADQLWSLVQAANAETTPGAAGARFDFDRAATAFAFLEQDQRVIDTLERQPQEALSDSGLILLGAALANVNRKPAAPKPYRNWNRIRWRDGWPKRSSPTRAAGAALPGDQSGGSAARRMGERGAKDFRGQLLPSAERRPALAALLVRTPTFLPAFYASLWMGDELASANAVGILLRIGTPEAIEAVRTFAFGRLGRTSAPPCRARAAPRRAVDRNRPLLLWQDGRYQEMLPPRYEIAAAEERDRPYGPRSRG